MHSICMWEVACGVGYEDRDFEFFVDVIVKEKYILYLDLKVRREKAQWLKSSVFLGLFEIGALCRSDPVRGL